MTALNIFGTVTVVRRRRALVDDGHGNEVALGDPEDVPIDGCSVLPGASNEDLQGRDAALIQWTVYAPPGADVKASDEIIYAGVSYAVDGEPQRFSNPFGFLDHDVLLLKRWEG